MKRQGPFLERRAGQSDRLAASPRRALLQRATMALLIASVAVGALARDASAPMAQASLALSIDEESLSNGVPLGAWTGKPPSLADANGDGLLDIIAQNQNQHVYVIDPRTGDLLVEVKPTYPYGPDLGPFNGPKVGDLDRDGTPELVNINRAAMLSVWTLTRADGGIAPSLKWEKHLNEHHGRPSADAGPVLADVNGDGSLEILAQTEETGIYALRADGTTLWSRAEYGGNAEPRVVDVDRDGDVDVLFFTDGGIVHAVEGRDGSTLWRFDALANGAWPASITSPGIVKDIDGDGRNEVVFCARNVENATPESAPGAPRYREHHFVLFAIRDAAVVWTHKPAWGNPLCGAYLMAFDADGDGKDEIYGLDWNTIGHKPGNWERLGPAHAFAFTHDGREIWHRSMDASTTKVSMAAGDWTGSG
jgi:outer membrane protein assembly factor BamB